jgi:hypothetical protein
MEDIAAAWNALWTQPLALVMALVAVACLIAAVRSKERVRDRLLAMALLSGMSAWIILVRGRWPK